LDFLPKHLAPMLQEKDALGTITNSGYNLF